MEKPKLAESEKRIKRAKVSIAIFIVTMIISAIAIVLAIVSMM